ncbi:MAG TPA: hypothetical protein VKA84_27365 [Gemmatimonadaceae bacterium]|nr:hypothetical protein [Gemmatimonadaceae bacterium]
MADRKQNTGSSGREGYGDDAGTRVGRPDAGGTDERSVDKQMARLSDSSADERGIEGSALSGSERDWRSGRHAAGGGSTEEGLESGGEAVRGLHEAQEQGGAGSGREWQGASGKSTGNTRGGAMGASGESSASGNPGRSGSEPLEGRTNEHQGGYGGQGGSPRTSSDSRGSKDPQVGATGRDQHGGMSKPNKDNVGG